MTRSELARKRLKRSAHEQAPTAAVEDQVLRRLREAEHVFCFLDYDGTLAPLAPTPEEALPVPGTADLLQKLVAAEGTRVAIVTGRTIADVRRFLDVPGVYYAGVHGLELEFPDGRTRLTRGVGLARAALPTIKRRVEQALAGRPGILIEDKGAALACHYRLASRADAVMARQTLAAVVCAYQRKGVPLMLIHGREVTEVRPAGVDKGEAVRALLATCSDRPLAVYIGDDRTDADAFAALPSDSITIDVGPADESRPAQYSLPGPAEVHRFLQALLACRLTRAAKADRSPRA